MISDIPQSSGIYRIICTETSKTYIGSALNLYKRQGEHFRTLRKNIHRNSKLQNAYNKYGKQAFIFEVIELVLIPELLTAREQYWMDKEKPLFNIAPNAGSTLGKECTPETRQKISDANRGKPGNTNYKPSPEVVEAHRQRFIGRDLTEEHKRKIGEAHTGMKRSPETREKMRNAALGHSVSEETRAKIGAKSRMQVCTDQKRAKVSKASRERPRTHEEYASRRKGLLALAPDGTEYIVDGTRKFAEEHGLDSSSMIKVARGKQSHTKGWKFSYLEEG